MLTTVTMRRALLSLTGAVLLSLGLLWRSNAWATPPAPGAVAPAAAPQSGAGAAGATAVAPAPAPTDPTKATIIFQTVPPANATVSWGKTQLGRIKPQRPLVVVRPRDSGPLDVMVRAPGYLAVQTRAHTFSDSRILVKLTPPEKKSELLGYRIPIDAGPEGGVLEGGVDEAGLPVGDGGTPWPAPPVAPPAAPAAPMLPMPMDAGVAY